MMPRSSALSPGRWQWQSRPGSLPSLLRLDARFRQRRALDRLDAHLRRDIGLGEDEIARETGKVLWDAPGWWR